MSSSGPTRHIYVHVPFCGRRCSYCDFAIAVRRTVPWRAFNDAIMAELATRSVDLDPGSLKSLYLGGGTPSKLGQHGIPALLAGFAHRLGVDNLSTLPGNPEITIEVNPEDVTEQAVSAWAAAGVNRASLGVQSFDPAVLQWMHREHGPEDSVRAAQLLRAGGIGSLSLDLIFALPDQLERDWTRDIELALELDPDHLSLYGLTVEPKTPLGRWSARGEVAEAPEERFEAEFLAAHRALGVAGYEHYEVSNYGRPGHRAVHNSAYWSGASYLGLGPSAHGFDGRARRWNIAAYAAWSDAVAAGADPLEGSEDLSENDRLAESIYLGLRTTDGLGIRQSDAMTVTPWIERGWARVAADRLQLTPLGWLRLDALAVALTSARSRS
ncbi:MAG: radical SAM family heme chaperone HemW [Gemmatimonadetes bacterium]|nr:radical SAM family heme chaperone HemW [Gemmatimonadota bacterium]